MMACFASCLLLTCGVAAAQSPPPPAERLELWGGLTLVSPRVDSALTTSYVPLIERNAAPLPGSTAGQTVALTSSNTRGVEGGVNYFVSDHVGVQVFLDHDRFDLSGANGNYQVHLNYTAAPPPDYVSRPYSYSRTDAPCDSSDVSGCVPSTSGRLRQTTLALNVVARWPLGRRIKGELSGGLSYFDIRGDAQALRYTVFEMGGHSTLFSQEYELEYSVGPAHTFGLNAGGTIDIDLGLGVSIVADARYFNGAELAAPVTVTRVLNTDEIVFLQDAETVQQTLQPPDVKINPVRARLMVGLKLRR